MTPEEIAELLRECALTIDELAVYGAWSKISREDALKVASRCRLALIKITQPEGEQGDAQAPKES
jgi:hypothetical protein